MKHIKDRFVIGDILTVEEFKNLKQGDIIHHTTITDEGIVRENDFDSVFSDAICRGNCYEITSSNCYSFYVHVSEANNKKLENYVEISGWRFTLRKAINKTKYERKEKLKKLYEI